jgi:hypothetical protein
MQALYGSPRARNLIRSAKTSAAKIVALRLGGKNQNEKIRAVKNILDCPCRIR